MSDEEFEEIHLAGRPRLCKRGVRYREMGVDEVRQVEKEAGQAIGKDGTSVEFINAKTSLGTPRMIVSVTDPVESLDGATWHTVTLQQLESPSSPYFFNKMFKRRDQELLGRAYLDLHDISTADVEAVLGKARTVLKE